MSATHVAEDRRGALVEAAIRVLADRGYRHASIDEIATEAGVAHGTVYLYFKSKSDVFHAIIDRYLELLEPVLMGPDLPEIEVRPDNYRDISRAYFRHLFRFFMEHRDLTKVIYREANSIDTPFENRWQELMDFKLTRMARNMPTLQEMGIIKSTFSPDAAFLYAGLLQGVIDYILRRESIDLDWLLDQWVEFLLHGCATDAVG